MEEREYITWVDGFVINMAEVWESKFIRDKNICIPTKVRNIVQVQNTETGVTETGTLVHPNDPSAIKISLNTNLVPYLYHQSIIKDDSPIPIFNFNSNNVTWAYLANKSPLVGLYEQLLTK